MEETTAKEEVKRRFRDIFISELKNSETWLFWFCFIWTAFHIEMMWVAFLSFGTYKVPEGMTAPYASLLGAYTTNKEVSKWVGKGLTINRPGEILFYAWWGSLIAMCFTISRNELYALPQEMIPVCLWVLGIFWGGTTSKAWRNFKQSSTNTSVSAEKK